MKIEFPFKLKSGHLMVVLVGLGLFLIAMAVLGLLGVGIPNKLASQLSNVVLILTLLIFLYSRKLRKEEAKARAAEKEKAESASG